MKKLSILLLLVAFGSCTREAWRLPLASARPDSAAPAELGFGNGKYKFTGPVTLTIQRGNHNVATPTTTGKTKAEAAAIGPGSSAASTQPAGPAWWVWGLVALAGAAGWEWLRGQLSPLLAARGLYLRR